MRKHAFFDHHGPIAMAHRGDHRRWTENTMEAFESAVSLGYRYLESDCHASADGVVVMAHDPDLRRIAGVKAKISDLTWGELTKIPLRCGARLARLDEALDSFPEIRFNLDAKSPDAIPGLASLAAGHQDRLCLGSFSHDSVLQIRRSLPHVAHSASPREVALLKWGGGRGFAADAAMIPRAAGPIPLATRTLIERTHRLGRFVHIWTVDRREDFGQLLELGVDGLMTDQPELLKTFLHERGQW